MDSEGKSINSHYCDVWYVLSPFGVTAIEFSVGFMDLVLLVLMIAILQRDKATMQPVKNFFFIRAVMASLVYRKKKKKIFFLLKDGL